MFNVLSHWVLPAVLGAIGGVVIQRAFERHRRRSGRIAEVRAREYAAYLDTLESISQATGIDLRAQAFAAMPSRVTGALSASGAAEASPADMALELSRSLSRMSDAMARARDGLQRLRLVASPEVLDLLDRYFSLQRQLYADAVSLTATGWRATADDASLTVSKALQARAERAEAILLSSIRQMRRELGIDVAAPADRPTCTASARSH